MSYAQRSRALRILGSSARELARAAGAPPIYRTLVKEITLCRSSLDRVIAIGTPDGSEPPAPAPGQLDVDRAIRRLFMADDEGDAVREPRAWHAIVERARQRLADAVPARELCDAFEGIDATAQLSRLARRVSDLTRGADEDQHPAVLAVLPPGRCGLALYRPIDLDKLAESNYLQLRFGRELHWTALLTAVDLIKHHARMLWRLLESQLTAAPLEARYQLMRRLAGERALTGRHSDQLRALSAPEALFLTIQPVDTAAEFGMAAEGDGSGGGHAPEPAAPAGPADPIAQYCVRLASLDRSATVIERRNPVTRSRLSRVLAEIDDIGSQADADPRSALDRLAACGSLLGDDILYGVSEHLAEVQPTAERAVHLVLQMPRELMRYPWELLRDRHGWLIERFALGRQVIADADAAPSWESSRRNGALRLLVVAPATGGEGVEIGGVGVLEGKHVAAAFERLQARLPGMVDEDANYRKYVGTRVTVEDFRALLRGGRFDVVHFAGHGRYDPVNPERSCWLFSDGPLYAFELRTTLANAEVTPWLVYGSACEGARDGAPSPHAYHDGVYGMASAALGQGVAAYIGPLWRISEADAKNLASAFYEALLLRRTSIGEALSLARHSVRDGEPDLDDLMTHLALGIEGLDTRPPKSAGWTGIVLYGDPTPTIMQRLSPSEMPVASRREKSRRGRRELVREDEEDLSESA
jgi:hypothetical protein